MIGDTKGIRREIMGGWNEARKVAWKAARGGNLTGDWGTAYNEFRSAGGLTAFQGERDLASTVKNVKRDLGESDPNLLNKIKDPLVKAADYIAAANESVENAVRLSAYRAARKRGLSIDRATQFAKNLTVDFNKGGEAKATMGAFYLFYNASIQGTFAMLNAMRSPAVRKTWAAVIAGGLLQEMIMSMVAPDDEDGENIYDKIPDWIKERNMIILTPYTERGYMAIPMPYGFNAAFGLGRNLGAVMRGKKNSFEAAGNSAKLFADTLSPIGSLDNVVSFLTPTLVDPLVELYATNEDFAGNKIVKEQSPWGPQGPLSHHYSANTNPALVGISQWLNKVSGGTQVVPGAINWSPERMEYAIEFFTGAAGATAMRLGENTGALLSGNLGDVIEESGVGQITLARKFLGSISRGTDLGSFIEGRDRVLLAEKDVKEAAEQGDAEGVAKLQKKWQKELAIVGSIKVINRERNKIIKALRQIDENPAMTEEAKEAAQDRLKESLRLLVNQGNLILNTRL